MNFKNGCLICGDELVYSNKNKLENCFYCKKEFETSVVCKQQHFVCDTCHSLSALDLIEEFCNHTEIYDPIELATILMRNEKIKMHGPEHHFLIVAVLLTSYYLHLNEKNLLKEKLIIGRKRAEKIPGGYCGTHGSCGAGIGTGIFISLITNANSLSGKEWQWANLITSKSLYAIAMLGGPRCCKRDVFLSIAETIQFLKSELNISLPHKEKISCEFNKFNKECLHQKCPYYSESF